MPRKPAIIPTTRLELQIPEDLLGRLTLELWSDLEGRVPYGKYSEFFISLLRDRFANSRMDLAEVVPGLHPGVHIVSGDPISLNLLRTAHHADHS